MENERELLGQPIDVVNVEDINVWGTLPSLPLSPQSSFKAENGKQIQSTVQEDNLIIHEITDKLLSSDRPEVDDKDNVDDKEVENSRKYIHFEVNPEINEMVSLWCGNIAKIGCEGAVVSCFEMLRDKQPHQASQFFRAGGTPLQKSVFDSYRCPTGDIVALQCTKLPIRHLLLTAGPRYNPKYQSAADNTLFNCYRNTFEFCLEKKIRTLLVGRLHNKTKGYPTREGIHLALRTTRRYLEHHSDRFNKICFVLENTQELSDYQEIFPCYFPRNTKDYKLQESLPGHIGGPYGEPQHYGTVNNFIKANWSTSPESLAKKLNVTQSNFATMKANPDSIRLSEQDAQPDIYNQLLQWSRTEDLSPVAKCRAVYHSGFDKSGCPVIVCVGKHFPVNTAEHIVLSHCVQVMDPISTKPYVMIYFHTACTGPRKDINLIQKMFSYAPARYKQNLKTLISVHSSKYQKFQTWWFTVSKAKEVKGKVMQMSSLSQLFSLIPSDQLQVPSFIIEYDYKESRLQK